MSNIYYLFSVNHHFFTDLSSIFQENKVFDRYYGLAYAKNSVFDKGKLYSNITYISDIIKSADQFKIDYEFLKKIEDNYKINLSELIHADRHLMRFNKEKRLRIVCHLLKSTLDEITRYKINLILAEGIDDFISIFLQKYCLIKEIKFVFIYQSGIGDNLFFTNRMDAGPIDLEKQFKEKKLLIKEGKVDFTEIRNILNSYALKKTQSTFTACGDLTYKPISYYDIKAFIQYAKEFISDKSGIHYDKHPLALIVSRLKRIINKNRYSAFVKKKGVSLEHLKTIPYFIYPLHFHPECATLTFGRWLNDQRIIIELISKNLPVGVFLAVKEHSHMIGRRNINFYKSIENFHNVLIIPTSISPYDLLPYSKGVVTISSTMGIECLLLKKPVISFGDRYYTISENVYRIQDFTNIQVVLTKALNHQFDEVDMLALFSVILENGKDLGYFTPNIYNKECLDKFALEIAKY